MKKMYLFLEPNQNQNKILGNYKKKFFHFFFKPS